MGLACVNADVEIGEHRCDNDGVVFCTGRNNVARNWRVVCVDHGDCNSTRCGAAVAVDNSIGEAVGTDIVCIWRVGVRPVRVHHQCAVGGRAAWCNAVGQHITNVGIGGFDKVVQNRIFGCCCRVRRRDRIIVAVAGDERVCFGCGVDNRLGVIRHTVKCVLGTLNRFRVIGEGVRVDARVCRVLNPVAARFDLVQNCRDVLTGGAVLRTTDYAQDDLANRLVARCQFSRPVVKARRIRRTVEEVQIYRCDESFCGSNAWRHKEGIDGS